MCTPYVYVYEYNTLARSDLITAAGSMARARLTAPSLSTTNSKANEGGAASVFSCPRSQA